MIYPRFSIFTPSHDPKYLDDAFNSVINQTFDDWEWIIMLNNGAEWEPPYEDDRVKIVKNNDVSGVGAAKRMACSLCAGIYLVELDHDDILSSDCLEELDRVFTENSDVKFAYSCTAQITESGDRNENMFNPAMGWTYSEDSVDGKSVLRANSFVQFPSTVSYIWFAPNHVRAFSRDLYERVGGYDKDLDVLDDQDLMSRLYEHTDFYKIDKCLYLQRVHSDNTQRDPILNQRIQAETVQLYDKYIERSALAWAGRNDLLALDFGAAHGKPEGYIGIDMHYSPNSDIVWDLNDGIPFEDNSIGVIRAIDFLEHFENKIFLFNEMYRVLAHGGMVISVTPSTDGRGAFQDPTHVAFYNENSFWYFTNEFYSKFVPEIKCKFQVSRLATYFPSEWHAAHDIAYVAANLMAVKEGPRIAGELLYS